MRKYAIKESYVKFLKSIFEPKNRGILLDIVVFLLNLSLMRLLTVNFIGVIQDAGAGDRIASVALFLFCLGIFILPPLGTTLKRWHFHHRRAVGDSANPENPAAGCLFNPIVYFCLNLIIGCFINAFVFYYFYGNKELNGATFIPAIFLVVVLAALQTYIVYRYFSPLKKAPPYEFLRDSRSEIIGDACLYLNMISFQLVWNILMSFSPGPLSGLTDFFGRLFFIGFIALLIYFPPRMFYLAEDLKRPRVHLTILLANAPVVLRVVFGLG